MLEVDFDFRFLVFPQCVKTADKKWDFVQGGGFCTHMHVHPGNMHFQLRRRVTSCKAEPTASHTIRLLFSTTNTARGAAYSLASSSRVYGQFPVFV